MHSTASLRPAAVDDDLSAPALPSGNRTRPLIAARLMCRSFLLRIDIRVRQESLQRKLRSHRASGSSGYSLLLENGRKDDLHANIHDTVNQCNPSIGLDERRRPRHGMANKYNRQAECTYKHDQGEACASPEQAPYFIAYIYHNADQGCRISTGPSLAGSGRNRDRT